MPRTAALSLDPLEAKEGPEPHILSSVPSGSFSLDTYPSVGLVASRVSATSSVLSGPGLDSGLLNLLS